MDYLKTKETSNAKNNRLGTEDFGWNLNFAISFQVSWAKN